MPRLVPLFALSVLLPAPWATGCAQEYSLQAAPGSHEAELGEPKLTAPPGGVDHGPEGPEGDGGSPWGSLDPGDLPEEFFSVVWWDPRPACEECSEPDYETRYDIVDVRGRVVVSFELPWPAAEVHHQTIHPAGLGRFLASSFVYETDTDSVPVKTWFGDGATGEMEVVVESGYGRTLRLPQARRDIEIEGGLGYAQILPDPSDPDRVFVLTRNTSMYANPLLGTLYSVHVRDPEAEVRIWTPEDMLHPSFIPEWGYAPWFPWFTEAFQTGTETTLVMGLMVQTEAGDWRKLLVDFSPETGPGSWEMDLTDVSPGMDFVVRPPRAASPGRVLFVDGPDPRCTNDTSPRPTDENRFASWDGHTLLETQGNDELSCPTVGPMLDESGETFLYYGTVREFNGRAPRLDHRLVVSHAGDDVWEYTHFRVGLSESPFQLLGIARIQPLLSP